MADGPLVYGNNTLRWFGDLDDAEKAKAREALGRHEEYRGRRLAWDGRRLWAHMRPPSQFWYLLNEDGSVPDGLQTLLDWGAVIDTRDGGYLDLVPVTG
jgi:hypothetical protein